MDAAQPTQNQMEPSRIVGISFMVIGVLGGMFFSRVIAAVFTALKWNNRALFDVEDLTLSALLGFAIALGAVAACWFNPKVKEVSLDVASELKKVTWPTFAETKISTIAVIIATIVSSLVLFSFDFIASKIMTAWLPSLLTAISKI